MQSSVAFQGIHCKQRDSVREYIEVVLVVLLRLLHDLRPESLDGIFIYEVLVVNFSHACLFSVQIFNFFDLILEPLLFVVVEVNVGRVGDKVVVVELVDQLFQLSRVDVQVQHLLLLLCLLL